MSIPENILSDFNTYAYHHYLVLCDSVITAEALASAGSGDQIYRTGDEAREIDGGFYQTLVDATTDPTLNIKSVTWNTVVAQTTKTTEGLTTNMGVVTDGEIVINEPLGAKFFNILQRAMQQIAVDSVRATFLLKTVFIGEDVEGLARAITNIRPMIFQAVDIKASFTSAGSIYKLSLVGSTGGAGKTPAVQEIIAGLSTEFVEGATLSQVFKRFETTLNTTYQQNKSALLSQFENSGIDITTQESQTIDIGYRITLDDEYNDPKYVVGVTEHIRIKNLYGTIMQFSHSAGIDKVVQRIMDATPAVVEERRRGVRDSDSLIIRRYIYKVVDSVRSEPNKYIIEYRIKRYEIPSGAQLVGTKNNPPPPGQSITFDYTFTGKNTDVIDFDAKFDMGLVIFHQLSTANNIPNKTGILPNKSVIDSAGKGKFLLGPTQKNNAKVLLALGKTSTNPIGNNSSDSLDRTSGQTLFQRHAALESIGVILKIHGNPILLDEMSISGKDVGTGANAGVNPPINPLWMEKPTFVKIDLRTPIDTNDLTKGFEKFWYDGFYMILEITHSFDAGLFTQELSLYSIPETDSNGADSQGESTEVVTPGTPKSVDGATIVDAGSSIPVLTYFDHADALSDDVNRLTDGDLFTGG